MQAFLLMLVAFLSGAILMALELVGSRLLAPSFGGSIFVWGSLIGVFMAALSCGYYLGGRLVDRWPSSLLLALLLAIAGGVILFLPRYGTAICDAIMMRDIGARAGPLLTCAILFFIPGMLMGVTSPFVIRLLARAVGEVGRTAGAVYAVSTVGSIVGTLATAFYLIPEIGTEAILYYLGGGLIMTALIAATGIRLRRSTSTAVVILLLLAFATTASARTRVLAKRDSPYHRLFVTENETYRWLRADNVWHSQMRLSDRHGRGLSYTDYADMAFLFDPNIRRVLVIGLGGGTIPKRFIRDYPQVSVTAVDIDPYVIDIAAKYFDVHQSTRLSIKEADGRIFLRRSPEKWDMIVLDAYYADSVPFFLTTREFFTIARAHLNPGGVLVNNVVSAATGAKSKFFRSVYRTMKDIFFQTHAFQVMENGRRTSNIEILAVNAKVVVKYATVKERAEQMQGKAIRDTQLVRKLDGYLGSKIKIDDVPTLTDDYAPVDALIHLW
jgi:spermidine synthase